MDFSPEYHLIDNELFSLVQHILATNPNLLVLMNISSQEGINNRTNKDEKPPLAGFSV